MVKFRWETEFRETEIGKIPKDWEVKKIEEIGEVSGGTTPSTKVKEYWDGNIPWITPKDLASHEYRYISRGERNITEKAVKDCSMKMYPPGTVLLTSRAPIGYVAIAKDYVTTNQGFRNIIPYDKRTSEYLYYLLKTMKNYLENVAGGSTFPELSGNTLKQLKIPYPPPEEQTRIATVLSWFDDLIENKRKQSEILEKIAMAIFKSWFIDFEPFQDEEFVYNEELDMEIPKGWEVRELKNIAEVIMGQSPPSKYYNQKGRGLPFIQGKGQFGRYTPHTDTYSAQISKLAKPLDILVTVRAPVGELNIADREYVIGRGVAALRSEFWTFLYAYLKTYNEVLKSFERGTTFDAITKPELESIRILLPPQPILQRFHSLVEPLFQKIILNQKEIMTLKKVRDTLLPLLVFGRLRVEDI